MGKAVPKSIKIRAETLLQRFPDKFGLEFDKNKAAIDELQLPFSKSSRNLIAGFITRKIKEKSAALKPGLQQPQAL